VTGLEVRLIENCTRKIPEIGRGVPTAERLNRARVAALLSWSEEIVEPATMGEKEIGLSCLMVAVCPIIVRWYPQRVTGRGRFARDGLGQEHERKSEGHPAPSVPRMPIGGTSS
jgi:hypothetical protein